MSPVSGRLMSRDHRQLSFEARDLSDRGLKLITSKSLAVGEPLTIEIETPRPVTLRGEVRWCQEKSEDGAYVVGVELIEDSRQLAALYAAIDAAGF